MAELSGGNQQKVVLAKWLAMKPRVMIFDEPTRGIDVGAKAEVYNLMQNLADAGVAILMISSDMEEVIGVSDRVAVMARGTITGILEQRRADRGEHPPARGRLMAGSRHVQKKDIGLALLVLVVGAVVAVINPRFLSPINLANTANLIGLFGLFSIAEAFVIVTAGIELSIGSVIALVGRHLRRLIVVPERALAHGAPSSCWCSARVLGFVHGWLVTRLKLQPFVVTLCGLLIYRGIARFYTADGTAGFRLRRLVSHAGMADRHGRIYGVPHSIVAFAVIAVIAWFTLHRTVFGRHLFAVGKNEEAARFAGSTPRA